MEGFGVKEVILTPQGHERLKEEIEHLSTVKRTRGGRAIKQAREFGDIAENSEYDDAKNEQAMLEHRIATLEERLKSARVIEKRDVTTDVVSVGTIVRLRDVDAKETIEYAIVPPRRIPPRTSERVARRQGHPGQEEGRDRRGRRSARFSQIQDHGHQGRPERLRRGLTPRPGTRPRPDGSTEALPRPGRRHGRACRGGGARARRGGCREPPARRSRPGRRGHGKLLVFDLVDRSGQIQRCAPPTGRARWISTSVTLSEWSARPRRPGGEPSLAVDEPVLLAKTAKPLPDTYHGLVDAETRYRKRYLDLLVNEDRAGTSRFVAQSSPRSAATSTPPASSRSRRRRCSPATAARSPSLS